MDQRGNQPYGGMNQPAGSMRPPMGYPPQVTGQMPQGQQPPYPPQPGQPTGYMPPQPMVPPQGTGQQPPYPPPMPPEGFPRVDYYEPEPVKPPRRPSGFLKFLQVLAVLVAVGAAAWYLYEALVPDREPYGVIEADTLGASYTGDCVIVRDETPYDAEGVTSVEHIAEEAATVRYSLDICEVYSSG